MRFSVGGGLGPFRVSQRIGAPRLGRGRRRPGTGGPSRPNPGADEVMMGFWGGLGFPVAAYVMHRQHETGWMIWAIVMWPVSVWLLVDGLAKLFRDRW